jgi:hypothetical protein
VWQGARAEVSELFEPILNGCGCFVAGTPVETDRGLVPIEQVKLGDRVRSRDEATGATSFRRVTALIRPQGREVYEVRLHLSGSRLDETFDVTGDHPWKSKDGHWLTTLQLAKGARLETEHGRSASVLWVTDTGHTARTYNLEVEGTHTFFVGKEHVWVHNACPLAGWATNEVHHLLPWQFARQFFARGLNPNNFTVTLPQALHRLVPGGVHTGPFASSWNGQWESFFNQFPRASAQDILAQLARMRVHFGI